MRRLRSAGPAKMTSLLPLVQPIYLSGSVWLGPSTRTSWIEPTRARFRCRLIPVLQFDQPINPFFLYFFGHLILHLRRMVPGLGEKMKVTESSWISPTTRRVSSKSSPPFPPKPHDKVAGKGNMGITSRMRPTRSRYCSLVQPLFIFSRIRLLPAWRVDASVHTRWEGLPQRRSAHRTYRGDGKW